MSFVPPDGALGAELAWFREDGRRHSLLTIAAPLVTELVDATRLELTLALHDVDGRFVTSWQRAIGPRETAFVDSREIRARFPAAPPEGALVAWVSAPDARHAELYTRATSMLDWFDDAGEIVSLHSDQVLGKSACAVDLTEIVFIETPGVRTALVIVNGPEAQPIGALAMRARNHRGEERALTYPKAMDPFSVHVVRLRLLTGDLIGFCDGKEATLEGTFEARGVFTRPYVITEGDVLSGYHGGNRYSDLPGIPRLVHRTLPYDDDGSPVALLRVAGQKEMNPAYAVHDASVTTRIHLFQSHGALDGDYAVDATLYDTAGNAVAHEERWAIAPRRGTASHDIAELLGDDRSRRPFEGHIALRFSDDAHESYPRRLQALVEYRTARSVARTMLWSDRWNAPDRLVGQRPLGALYRVFSRGPRRTRIAITNPGVGRDYDREASYRIRLRTARGDEIVRDGRLGPHATTVATIDEVFPDRPEDELALAIVESPFDLATIQLTTDQRTGVLAVEHLCPMPSRDGRRVFWPCGD